MSKSRGSCQDVQREQLQRLHTNSCQPGASVAYQLQSKSLVWLRGAHKMLLVLTVQVCSRMLSVSHQTSGSTTRLWQFSTAHQNADGASPASPAAVAAAAEEQGPAAAAAAAEGPVQRLPSGEAAAAAAEMHSQHGLERPAPSARSQWAPPSVRWAAGAAVAAAAAAAAGSWWLRSLPRPGPAAVAPGALCAARVDGSGAGGAGGDAGCLLGAWAALSGAPQHL